MAPLHEEEEEVVLTMSRNKPTTTAFPTSSSPSRGGSMERHLVATTTRPSDGSTSALTTATTTTAAVSHPDPETLAAKILEANAIQATLVTEPRESQFGLVSDESNNKSDRRSQSINVGVSTTKRYNFMVAGPAGSGKSTFCTRLLQRYFPQFKIEAPEGPTMEIGERGRCEKVQGDTHIIVTVVDTPGFGDSINNNDRFQPVEDYIVEQNRKYEREEGYRRPNRQEKDTRVHCCFYFIMPHRVTILDREFMRRLQSKVAVVPIVAKADTMQIPELAEHLLKIQSFLNDNSIKIFDFGEQDIVASWLDQHRLGARITTTTASTMTGSGHGTEEVEVEPESLVLPRIHNVFAVISGERQYMWGKASEEDPRHSDTQRLHKVLFQDGSLGKLHQYADEIHEAWRLNPMKGDEDLLSEQKYNIFCGL